jgi:hypothetical protein
MAEILDHIYAKLDNANYHFERLKTDIRDVYRPVQIETITEADTVTLFMKKAGPVPYKTLCITADVLQNLHVPLDYIAFEIVLRARIGVAPKGNVYFPFADNRTTYERRRNKYLQNVSPQVLSVFDSIEPFRFGENHDLWVLHEVSSPEKHERLLTAVPTGEVYETEHLPFVDERGIRGMKFIRGRNLADYGPLTDNILLYQGPINGAPKYAANSTVGIYKQGVLEYYPLIHAIEIWQNDVNDVVERFKPYLS